METSEVKNYRINFMDGEHVYITARQKTHLFSVMNESKFFNLNDNLYATHQVKNIRRISKEEEKIKFGAIKDGDQKLLN